MDSKATTTNYKRGNRDIRTGSGNEPGDNELAFITKVTSRSGVQTSELFKVTDA